MQYSVSSSFAADASVVPRARYPSYQRWRGQRWGPSRRAILFAHSSTVQIGGVSDEE